MSEQETSIDRVETLAGQPAVSIIIPAYDIAPYINETLESVFAQTFSDFEVVLINDGSPDTEEFERALEPYRDKIIYLKQENRGAAAARNCGLRRARGKFVAFLDGDDLWAPSYLEEQLKFIEAGNYDLVYADALIVGDSPLAGRTFMETAPSEGEVTTRSLLLAKCNVITSGVVARRQLVIDAGLFDETLRNSHDFDLWVRLAKFGAKLAYQRKVLLTYRCHEGSLSGDSINNVVRQLRVYEKIQRSYDLTPDERADIRGMVENLNAELELETGKLHLLEGRFNDALCAFRKANVHSQSWKLRATIFLLRLCPGLVLQVYRSQKQGPKQIGSKA
jgi:glycosyltransferase involved in cell wall biosynthesis